MTRAIANIFLKNSIAVLFCQGHEIERNKVRILVSLSRASIARHSFGGHNFMLSLIPVFREAEALDSLDCREKIKSFRMTVKN